MRILLGFIAACKALEKCQGEHGVEDHHKDDVEVRVVVGLSGGGSGENWSAVGHRTHCGVGNGPVYLVLADVEVSVFEDLLASGEKKKQKCPVHDLLISHKNDQKTQMFEKKKETSQLVLTLHGHEYPPL